MARRSTTSTQPAPDVAARPGADDDCVLSFPEYMGPGGLADLPGQVAAARRVANGKAKAGDLELLEELLAVLDDASWAVGARNLHQSARKLRQRAAVKPHLVHRHAADALDYLERLRPCVGAPALPRTARVELPPLPRRRARTSR